MKTLMIAALLSIAAVVLTTCDNKTLHCVELPPSYTKTCGS